MYRTLSLSLALLTVLPAAACVDRGGGDDPDAQDVEAVSTAIEQTNGGFDTSDEAVQFGAGADFAAAAIEADAAATDTLAADPATIDLDSASAASGLRVLVVWGRIPADRDATEWRDWTGSLEVSRGGLLVRRTIAFEDRTDHLLPRASIDTVAFASVTGPFVDGLALSVLERAEPTVSSPLTLTYTSADGASVFAFDLAQLASGPIVVDAGGGNKMVAVGVRRQADPCDRGFMRGRWHVVSRNLGRFLGVVTDENGEPAGHVRGVFGQRRSGEPVLFGKFINREGHFRGLLAGTFADGTYRARWITRDGDHGTAHGVYFEGATPTSGGFLGRWAETSCTTDAPPVVPTE